MRYQAGLIGFTLLSLTQIVQASQEAEVRVIIKYKHPTTLLAAKEQLSKRLKQPIKSMIPMAGGAYVLTLQEQKKATGKLLNTLKQEPSLQFAVEDRVGHFIPLPDLPEAGFIPPLSHELQWDEFLPPAGVMLESSAGRQDGAWAYTHGEASKPIVVAVLDTGVENHPSLNNNIVKDQQGAVWGWNFAGNNRDVRDETGSWHGTHVAGTIAAYGDVMSGMGDALKILPVKIPDASGMFYESQVINAIYWSVGGEVPGVPHNPWPAKVLNMSFGVDEKPGKEIDHCDEALQEALFFVRKQGAVVAAAAGNDNRWEHYNAPAVCNGTMKVASTGPEGLRAYYSNYGPGITFAAPGGDVRKGRQGGILSTVKPGEGHQGSGFNFYQGTSMATPHAAGIAGLIYAVKEGAILPEKVEQILFTTTHAFGKSNNPEESCIGKKPCGHGILDANQAVKAALANYDVIFSSPSAETLASLACHHAGIKTGAAYWKKTSQDCADPVIEPLPVLEQNQEGQILVHYGRQVYALDQSIFKQCQIIGVDGVGCYY